MSGFVARTCQAQCGAVPDEEIVMANHFEEALERIKKSTGVRTQVDLANILGIRQSSISDAKKRNSVPADWYLKLYRSHGLNPDWLADGVEPVYLKPSARSLPVASEACAPYGSPARSRPVQVVAVTGKTDEEGAPIFETTGEITVPDNLYRPSMLVMRMDGTSMEPAIRKGAYFGLDRDQRRILSGEIYGIHVPYEGVVVKRVIIALVESRYVLRSENKSHPESYLPFPEGEGRIVGRVVWVLQEI